jgi:hypothetical protein
VEGAISSKQIACLRSANLLAKKLKEQEVRRKQKFHLCLLSAALEERKCNPCWHPEPTPEQEREAREKEMTERASKAREGEFLGNREKKCKADEARKKDLHISQKKLEDEECLSCSRVLDRWLQMSEDDQVWLNECHKRARALATAQSRANPTFTRKGTRRAAQETATSTSKMALPPASKMALPPDVNLSLLSPAKVAWKRWLGQRCLEKHQRAGYAGHARYDDGSHGQDCSRGCHHPRKGRPNDPYCT